MKGKMMHGKVVAVCKSDIATTGMYQRGWMRCRWTGPGTRGQARWSGQDRVTRTRLCGRHTRPPLVRMFQPRAYACAIVRRGLRLSARILARRESPDFLFDTTRHIHRVQRRSVHLSGRGGDCMVPDHFDDMSPRPRHVAPAMCAGD